jgi:hypothetical protein
LYISERRWENKRLWTGGSKHSPNLICCQFLRERNFDFYCCFQIFEFCRILKGLIRNQ